jgi:hypothetical protein
LQDFSNKGRYFDYIFKHNAREFLKVELQLLKNFRALFLKVCARSMGESNGGLPYSAGR